MNKRSFYTETIRVFVFAAIIFSVIILNWWIILIAFVLFPSILRKMKNKRNGKINIGNLVNHITKRITTYI